MVVAAIFITLMGILMLVRPSVIWTIAESWKSNDATEPSDMYVLLTRIHGVICTLVGIVVIFVYLFLVK